MYVKTRPARNANYRRLVAMLPCILCGIDGYSQAAHPNTGKGMAMKADDTLCFPLCSDRYGMRGCHFRFDQGAIFDKATRRELEPRWAEETRARLAAMGVI
jgi:hypothetical protein